MPMKPNFNGVMYVNVGPATHKRIHTAAKRAGMSMTAFMVQAAKEKLARKEQS